MAGGLIPMSVRDSMPFEYPLILSQPARKDLRDIFAYTLQHWGEAQLRVYRDRIDAALKALSLDPSVGKSRHGYKTVYVGRHHIYYRHDAAAIFIVRILHERMDATRHLGG
jgi:toxin ParE1/3/4